MAVVLLLNGIVWTLVITKCGHQASAGRGTFVFVTYHRERVAGS